MYHLPNVHVQALVADFEVAEGIYFWARIENTDSVCLWLGANVMLEYSYEEVASVDCTVICVIFELKFLAEFGKPDIILLDYYTLFLQANALLKKNLENMLKPV